MISVSELMKNGALRQCRVVAGRRGMDKQVKYVTIMEVPDIINWLKGNELLLTSLYAIKDDIAAQQNLVAQLHEAGTTALAIKPFRFVDDIPQVILDEAEKYDFPVIEVPREITFIDIISPAMNAIFNEKVVLQEDLDQASQLLNEISLSAQGIDKFIEALSYLTKNAVTVESQLSYIDVPEPPFPLKPLRREQLKELAFIKHPVRLWRQREHEVTECIVAPIIVDGQLYGNITCWGFNAPLTEIDLAILEKASSLLALEFLRMKVKFDVEQQYKNEFLRDLLLNETMDVADLKERGEKYRFSPDLAYTCMAIQFPGQQDEAEENRSDVIGSTESVVHFFNRQAIVGYLRGMVCTLYPTGVRDDHALHKQAAALHERLAKNVADNSSVRIGVGRHYPGVAGLRTSFQEAEKAVTLGSKVWEDRAVIHYNDLGVYRLIAQFPDTDELARLYRESVAKLVDYDRESDLELLKTLRTYFKHNEKLGETADRLFIHVNTLKYRMSKIEKLTGLSLNRSEDKLMLHLGLKIHEFMSSDHRFKA